MAIYLIRHGETDGNKDRVVQVPQTPLNKSGMAQAARLALRLRGSNIRRILSSDLTRAHMTAEPLEESLGVEIEPEPLLQERNFGDLRGRPYASLGFDPMAEGYAPPGGESWDVFHERAARAWQRVTEAAAIEGDLAIVTHGLVCHSFELHHLTRSPGTESTERWGNTSLTIIEEDAPWKIRLLNCTDHLDGDVIDDTALKSGF